MLEVESQAFQEDMKSSEEEINVEIYTSIKKKLEQLDIPMGYKQLATWIFK